MQDFTEGTITRHVIRFSLPIMAGNMLLSLYGIINMIWVGQLLGHTAVAAVSATMPIVMLLPAVLIGLSMATNILISQAFGRKDIVQLRKILSNSFISSLLLCLLISAIGIVFRRELLGWVHTPEEIRDMALSYLTIVMATLVFQFFLNWMNGMLRGLGDADTVLKILGLLTVCNIVFVPALINGIGPLPPLGVDGAAWGSALAALVAGGIGYGYLSRRSLYIRMRSWDFRMDWHIVRQVFAIGIPASLQMIVVSLSGVLIISLVNRFGADVTAAFGIGMQVDLLAGLPSMSIGMAATSIAGQNLGAQKAARVFDTLRVSILLALAIALFFSAVLTIFPYEIGALFMKESAGHARVLDAVKGYYRWIAFIFPCFAVTFSIQGVLRGAGDTVALMALSFIALIVIRIPLAHLLAGPLGCGEEGVWMAILISSLLAVGLNGIYYKKGKWLERQILTVK